MGPVEKTARNDKKFNEINLESGSLYDELSNRDGVLSLSVVINNLEDPKIFLLLSLSSSTRPSSRSAGAKDWLSWQYRSDIVRNSGGKTNKGLYPSGGDCLGSNPRK